MTAKKLPFLVIVVLLSMPSVALANVGTPLMWATMLHLAFGNAFIGILEGGLLTWFQRCGRFR